MLNTFNRNGNFHEFVGFQIAIFSYLSLIIISYARARVWIRFQGLTRIPSHIVYISLRINLSGISKTGKKSSHIQGNQKKLIERKNKIEIIIISYSDGLKMDGTEFG